MSFADRLKNFLAPLVPSAPVKVTPEQLRNPIAYVDPSKQLAQWTVHPYNPSWLVSRRGLQIFDAMKRDEQVKAALKFKKSAVLASGWEVASPGEQEDDWEVTRFVQYCFDNLKGGMHGFLFNGVLSALDYGYSVIERVYGEEEAGEWKGKLTLNRLLHLKPHYLDFVTDPYGTLLGVRQSASNLNQLDLPPGKFVIYSHSKEFENYYGHSDLEAAYRAWWVKENTYKWLAVCLERYGMSPLFAMYNFNAYGPGQVEELKKVVKNIQNATMGVIPRGTKDDLEFWSQSLGQGNVDQFLAAIRRFDGDISRALLVPGLIGMTPDESTGSLARAGQHFDSFMQVIVQIQLDIASNVMNAQVIPQLCDLNFPNLDEYPKFQFLPFRDAQRLEILRIWSELVTGKIVNRIEDDEQHIRATLGFPENADPVLEPLPGEMDPGMLGDDGMDLFPGGKGKTPDEGERVPDSNLTQSERDYAMAEGCTWRTINGKRVCIRTVSNAERVRRAISTHKPSTGLKQSFANRRANQIAQLIGGKNVGFDSVDFPVDVTVKLGGKLHGIEVKTLMDNGNDKITMHPDSLRRKLAWGKVRKAELHTVIIDGRNVFDNGKYAKQYSGHTLYYKKGVGSFRLGTMTRVKNAAQLKALIEGKGA